MREYRYPPVLNTAMSHACPTTAWVPGLKNDSTNLRKRSWLANRKNVKSRITKNSNRPPSSALVMLSAPPATSGRWPCNEVRAF